MTAEFEKDAFRDLASLAEPPRRSGSIVLVLLVAGALVAVALALMALGRVQAQPYILGLLALLAMIGLFSLFAFAAGILRFADRAADDPDRQRLVDVLQREMPAAEPDRGDALAGAAEGAHGHVARGR